MADASQTDGNAFCPRFIFHLYGFLFGTRSSKILHQIREEAARQQGGLFFRENSSNGGKAIRTFWRNTKFGKMTCQGQNSTAITRYLGISYGGDFPPNRVAVFAIHSLHKIYPKFKGSLNQPLRPDRAPYPVHILGRSALPLSFWLRSLRVDPSCSSTQINSQKLRFARCRFSL
ncbi:MAG: hypothetical protein JWQ42_4548 [Edaphobacter sp.]|nr:hypothetical protein [Edaphobacter sp.]